MDRVTERCCGLDVHRDTVAACVRIPGPNGTRAQHVRTFSTTTQDLLALRDWLEAHEVSEVAMESTGVYWKPVYYMLEERVQCRLVRDFLSKYFSHTPLEPDPHDARGVRRIPGGRAGVGGVRMEKETAASAVVLTLSEEACQLALHSRHMGLSLASQVWLKIENATIDRSLGEGQARRHPMLDREGAQILRDYDGRSADAFTTSGDR
jgi:hypothetical protein